MYKHYPIYYLNRNSFDINYKIKWNYKENLKKKLISIYVISVKYSWYFSRFEIKIMMIFFKNHRVENPYFKSYKRIVRSNKLGIRRFLRFLLNFLQRQTFSLNERKKKKWENKVLVNLISFCVFFYIWLNQRYKNLIHI